MRSREPAICVRTTDYSETSQVVHFLTRGEGLVSLLAKGTKRPKSKSGGAIDLLSEGELVFTGASRVTLGTLIEFTESAVHLGLRKDSAHLNVALYMLELIGQTLAAADPHEEVFDLLHNALARLDQADAPAQAVLAFFQWRLARHIGLLGQLSACVGCGQMIDPKAAGGPPGGIYFSSIQGGLLCQACEGSAAEKYRVDTGALSAIGVMTSINGGTRGQTLSESHARSLNRLLAYHIAYQRGKKFRMARHAIG